ncbi:SDR family NAD(P)-dependent oxidoreductase [Paenibacillus sp. GCM10027626]|uniref:SDR family NAD(P)-dependent oxidoreductase n=1 Tax=Paenibacillus sp. GCM10027626 TaxID=3273411 RepID=UPI003631197E
MKFAGKRVLVTGAARGIGEGIARRFLEEGAKVIALDYREDQLAEQAEKYKANLPAGAAYGYIVADLRQPEQAAAAVQQAWAKWDGLDVVVNNAGIAVLEPFEEITYNTWSDIMNVNLNAMFVICQEAGKLWMNSGTKGAIVNMASKNGLVGQAKLAHYNASKGGVVMLTQSLAVELAEHNVRVNAIAPGFIDTPLDREVKAAGGNETIELTRTPMKRMGTIDEVAQAVMFLASEDASYISGTTLVVDGGHMANGGSL